LIQVLTGLLPIHVLIKDKEIIGHSILPTIDFNVVHTAILTHQIVVLQEQLEEF
jgi:hypothetical protein